MTVDNIRLIILNNNLKKNERLVCVNKNFKQLFISSNV